VSGPVWRLVARQGFAGIRGVCEVASGDRLAAIAHWCAALSDAQADWLPPVEVVRALYASVQPDDRGRRLISRSRFSGPGVPFLRAALRVARDHARAGTLQAFLDDDLPLADRWWRTTWPRPDANQQHSGWDWILRQAHAWREAVRWRLGLATAPLCRPALAEFSNGSYRAKVLATALALFDEGCAMRNCLHGYIGKVSKGRVLVYAIRPLDPKGVAASAEFQRDDAGRWHTASARAFANQQAPAPVLAFCEALADAINQAHSARRARVARAVRRGGDRSRARREPGYAARTAPAEFPLA